jgi:hypothetical protein
VRGGIGGSVAPLDTTPAPFGSSTPPVSATSGATRGGLAAFSAPSAAGATVVPAMQATTNATLAHLARTPWHRGFIVVSSSTVEFATR